MFIAQNLPSHPRDISLPARAIQAMKLHAVIFDHQAAVQFRDEGAHVLAEIDGRSYRVDVQSSGDNGYLLVWDGKVFDCHVEGSPESGKTLEVVVGSTRYPVTLTDPKRLRGSASASAHPDEAARIIAPMPGKVVRVLVKAGAQVEFGEGIVVVEAMKMQNEMKSPKAGTVVTLNVEVGATVNAGDVLAVIE
jgi:biotin carboxyl carrier protein